MKYLYLAISILLFVSCEDVIDLPLEEGPKRLVIDANINWEKGTSGKDQSIRLTQTAGFYDLTVPIATRAVVKITNTDSNVVFPLIEDPATGIYETSTFVPVINANYELEVIYNGDTFTARETLLAAPLIERIEQTTANFFGTDAIKVEFFFQDDATEENYYASQFNYPDYSLDVYRTRSDEFSNGQENSFFEQDENLTPSEALTMYFYSFSKTNFNYMNLLLDQISSGGPFASPPAAVKGNCINTTTPEEKPYGYFRLSEMVVEPYTIKNEDGTTLPPFQ